MENIKIRKYHNDDNEQIIKLLNRNFYEQQHVKFERDIDWWKWKYEDNPFGKPLIYIAEDEGEIIAFRTFWPWQLNIRGKEIMGYQALDSVVDKKYRGKGLFSFLTTRLLEENKVKIDLIFNFPNQNSIGAYTRIGWSFVGRLEWYVKVNNLYKSIKLINSTGLNSVDLNPEDKVSEEQIKKIKFDLNYDNKIKTIKDKDFLLWRYLHHPKINYGMDILSSGRKQLVYFYEINENQFGREMIVLDYFGEMQLFDEFLKTLDLISKKYNVSFISMLNKYNTPEKKLIKKLYLKQKRKNFVTLPLNLELEQIATRYNNWDIFLGMHDSI